MRSASAIHDEGIYRDTARKEETRLGTERAYISSNPPQTVEVTGEFLV